MLTSDADDTLDKTIVDVPLEDAGREGWLRWELYGDRRLDTHGHEDVIVWWLDAAGHLHRSLVETCEAPCGRELHVAFGAQPDAETEAVLLAELREDLERGERPRWQRGAGVGPLDRAIEEHEEHERRAA